MSPAFASLSYVSSRKGNFIIGNMSALNDVQSIAELIMGKFHLARSHRNIASLN